MSFVSRSGIPPEQFGLRMPDEPISCCSLDGTRYDDLGWPYYEIIQIMAGQKMYRQATIMRMLTLSLFGGDMRRAARCACATSAGNGGRRCSARGKSTGCPGIGARQTG